MAYRRVILEMGSGTDLHGGDYTRAACRAVDDAIHHASLTMVRSLGVGPEGMRVEVTIGVQAPEHVDRSAVAAMLPYGEVRVQVVHGGLDVPDEVLGDGTVIASAAVAVSLDLPERSNEEESP